jgi:hypothetical protein
MPHNFTPQTLSKTLILVSSVSTAVELHPPGQVTFRSPSMLCATSQAHPGSHHAQPAINAGGPLQQPHESQASTLEMPCNTTQKPLFIAAAADGATMNQHKLS